MYKIIELQSIEEKITLLIAKETFSVYTIYYISYIYNVK